MEATKTDNIEWINIELSGRLEEKYLKSFFSQLAEIESKKIKIDLRNATYISQEFIMQIIQVHKRLIERAEDVKKEGIELVNVPDAILDILNFLGLKELRIL